MKHIYPIVFAFSLLLAARLSAQPVISSDGYHMRFGTSFNTAGTAGWLQYGSATQQDSMFQLSETATALIVQGRNIVPQGIPFFWGGIYTQNSWSQSIDLSSTQNKVLKIRMRSTGTLHPVRMNIRLTDNTGASTMPRYDNEDYLKVAFIPSTQFEDYYINYNNLFKDHVVMMSMVDSNSITGLDINMDLDSTAINNLSSVRLEIQEISIGSYVTLPAMNWISGKLYYDMDGDCTYTSGDVPISHSLVSASPGNRFVYSDEEGNYSIAVDSALSSVTIRHLRSEWMQDNLLGVCPAADKHIVAFTDPMQNSYCCYDFAEEADPAPRLSVDVFSNRRRRCFRNSTAVSYNNTGTGPAENTIIKVEIPEYVEAISSNPAWTSKSGKTLYYNLGTLPANSRCLIVITDSVVCGIESIRGLSQCTKASISSSNETIPDPASWDNSTVALKGHCNNGTVRFTLSNEGTGNMQDSLKYFVYVNDTLIMKKKFRLKASRFFTVDIPAGLNTIRMEAEQSAFHPEEIIPKAVVEACVTDTLMLASAVRNLVNSSPVEDPNEKTSVHCLEIRDSYDPNDKQAVPVGKTASHFVLAGTWLDYQIRFENTGSDTAYTVVVVDTLDAGLDITTLKAGASSHLYKLKTTMVDDKMVCSFRFDQINLTAKSMDSIKSQGFVKFSIQIKPDLSDGTVIENKAGIYFDYNSPIITNTVMHTIGDYQETDFSRSGMVNQGSVLTGITDGEIELAAKLYPNPFRGELFIGLPDDVNNAEISLYSNTGTLILKQKISGTEKLNTQPLQEGMYYYRITGADGSMKSGKIIRQ